MKHLVKNFTKEERENILKQRVESIEESCNKTILEIISINYSNINRVAEIVSSSEEVVLYFHNAKDIKEVIINEIKSYGINDIRIREIYDVLVVTLINNTVDISNSTLYTVLRKDIEMYNINYMIYSLLLQENYKLLHIDNTSDEDLKYVTYKIGCTCCSKEKGVNFFNKLTDSVMLAGDNSLNIIEYQIPNDETFDIIISTININKEELKNEGR